MFSYAEVDYLRSTMVASRSRHLETWRLTASFMAPNRFRESTSDRNNGSRKDQKIVNNVQRRALRNFTSGMLNGATSKHRPWFEVTVANETKANDWRSRKYFSAVQKSINNHFLLSNLYRVLTSSYKDIGVFSNAAFAMLPHPTYKFWFYPFSVGTYCFGTDHEGKVNLFARDFVVTIKQCVEQYGRVDATGHIDWTGMDPWIKYAWDNKMYVETVTLSNVIVPNPKPVKNPVLSKDKKFQSYTYIKALNSVGSQVPASFRLAQSAGLTEMFLSVKGFDYFPVICPRWEVMAEDDYGIDGPGEIALADVMSLQEMDRYGLEGIAKLVKPPMVGPSSLRRHQASILAGGITYVDESSESAKFRPAFEIDPKLAELVNRSEKYEAAVSSAFFEDLFLMLANERTVSHVTAEEIQTKQAEKLAAIGPVLSQLDEDQNGPIIDNAFNILNEAGEFPPPPKILDGESTKIDYISTLAQAAKAGQVNSAERLVSFTTSLAQAVGNPALVKMLKDENIVRQYARDIGVDPESVTDEFEYSKIKQIQAQQAAQQAQQQALAQAATSAKDMASAKLGDSNLLEKIVSEGGEVI